MTKDLYKATGNPIIGNEIVAKFAMAEELRLVSSKMDRMYAELSTYLRMAYSIQTYLAEIKKGHEARLKEFKRKENGRRKKIRNERTKGKPPLDQL